MVDRVFNCKLEMNYKIILDENLMWNFVQLLPQLDENEIYYGCLFARSKYCKDVVRSSDKTQLKRFTFKKENFIDKVRQLECAVGFYKLKGGIVPQEALVLYVNPNPRDQKKATYASIVELTRLIERNAKNYNLHQEVMSNVQRSKGTTHFVDFDFDLEDKSVIPDILSKVTEFVGPLSYVAIETRGGMHVLVMTDRIGTDKKKTWYNNMKTITGIDQSGDQLIPVVGGTQGGFMPKFINL
jgi:hypothetical protein